MAIKQCKECNGQVSSKADKCPTCGAPVKGKMTLLKLIGVGFVTFVAIGMCAAAVGKDGPKPSTALAGTPRADTEAEPAAAAGVQILDVPINDLLGTYKDNELRGDQAYKGKLVRVSGKVDDVKKDIMGSPFVTIGTGAQFEIPTVQCSLAKNEAGKAANLTKGETVSVVGTVDGLMMNVLIDDCMIE